MDFIINLLPQKALVCRKNSFLPEAASKATKAERLQKFLKYSD